MPNTFTPGGGGRRDIAGPGGENPYAKKKKKGFGVDPNQPSPQPTGPGSIYHGWNTPGAPEGGKQWGAWGPLTAGAGGQGGDVWDYLHGLDPAQKQAVFGWLGKNYSPESGQTGSIASAQSMLKGGNYADFLKMAGAGGGGGSLGSGGGGGGAAPRTSPFYQDQGAGGGAASISGPILGAGGGGGMNAPISGPLTRDVLPEFPQASNPYAPQGRVRQNPNSYSGNPYLRAFGRY